MNGWLKQESKRESEDLCGESNGHNRGRGSWRIRRGRWRWRRQVFLARTFLLDSLLLPIASNASSNRSASRDPEN